MGASNEGHLFWNWASYGLLGLPKQSKVWDNKEMN
jgi:hypothetical protein